MQEQDVFRVMILLAVITPVVGAVLFFVGRLTAEQSGEPMPRNMRRNAWILFAAGPVNLLLWWLFNKYLDQIGSRSVFGLVLAVLVFIIGGVVTGFFSRLRSGGAPMAKKRETQSPPE